MFLTNSTGELTYDGMYSRRIARLRICLRLWFARTGGGGTPPATSHTGRLAAGKAALMQLCCGRRRFRPVMRTTRLMETEAPM